MSFVHLHVHSEYSLLDGFSNIKKLVKRAKEMNMPAVALTDHGTMFGVIDFYNAAIANDIKPIVGVEAYLAARGMSERDPQFDKKSSHLLLLAENETGYRNLLQIASAAQLNGFYYYPRIDHELLAKHSEGLICTSGCMSAEVPRLIQQGDLEGARRQLDWYYQVFGPDRFYLELQQHDIPELDNINKMLVDLGRRYQARFVATNDVHYINREDARLQDILLAIQTGCVLTDPNRMRMTDKSYYLRSPQEMAELFAEIPEALSNTLLIAERCNIDLGFKGYHLPQFEVPEGYSPESYLRQLCESGLQQRYGPRTEDPQVRQRLEYELGVIHKMGFDTYFLIVWDLCRQARDEGIWYNARGSAAGSIVAYTLDITRVDPIEHGLIFERFLNPGRISMPDIDLDFRDDRRVEMLEYTARKYGDDKVAQIVTFGTLGARAAIRDVGRVMDIPLNEVDRVAKLIPNIPGKPVSVEQALEEISELKDLYKSTPYLQELIDTAKHMEGVVRNAGTHAAGVIITDKPTIEYIPLHRPTGNASDEIPIKTVTQFEMSVLESLGLLKVDFLGLDTLSIMARACDLICKRHGVDFNLDNIPVDDPATYELLGRGDTAGVFQVEGQGMRRWLMQMKPRELANVIAMVALFRPGPMDFIPGYIRRMHGEEQVEYRHPDLEPIFQETYGYPVYQEQLMFAVMNLAGYTAPEADDLRKAISKKQKEKLLKHREKFVKGAQQRGMPAETATAIFDDWEEFARYGFNKCLPGDAEVLDAATGQLVKVEDLYYGRSTLQETLTCDLPSLRLQPGRVSAVMFNGVKPVFRLTTALGRSIEATGNHPLYTCEGWRNLETLQAGDYIAVPRRLPVEGAEEWPEHEIIALAQKIGIWGKNAREKEVPAEVFLLKNWQIALLISRMWEGDGHINVKSLSLYYVTASQRMARQLQHLLLRLGIISRLREVRFPYKDGRTGYQVFITRGENIQAFAEQIGVHFLSERRRTALQLLCQKGHGRSSKDVVPVGSVKALIRAARDRQGITWKQLTTETGIAARDRQGISWKQLTAETGTAPREFHPTNSAGKLGFTRSTLARLADTFDDAELRRWAESDIYWDRIVAVEPVGEKPTYDLEVPGSHNFVANDVLVHNSHAADYGIISVQTAYLKAHYPAEYMTAVLSVRKNETEKVALYVVDCRRMGIPVEPPDVNISEYDFTIEDREDGTCAIRFGLGAVKNVGQTPVEAILKARGDSPFQDLNDFARRADLRQVGRRALESLIKVGALDRFGPRIALLETIERIISVSTSHFRAAEMGQMSLFGQHTGITEEITLPNTTAEISRREVLNWERELIGLYVSDHPLSPVIDDLTEAVSHFSGQLSEASANQRVRVAGLITRIRHHQSKAGKPMGFVTIEDLQGSIDLVIFPKVWEKLAEKIEYDNIILVDGRVDAEGAEPKVLVDNISTDFTRVVSHAPPSPGKGFAAAPAGEPQDPWEDQAGYPPASSASSRSVKEAPAGAVAAAHVPSPDESGELDEAAWDGDLPPPPDAFPPDWESFETEYASLGMIAAQVFEGEGDSASAAPAAQPEPAAGPEARNEPPVAELTASRTPELSPEASVEGNSPAQAGSADPIPPPLQVGSAAGPERPASLAQYIVPPVPQKEGGTIHMITVVLRSTEDKTRDVLRIRRIHGTLMSYPGNDRFAFQIYERGRGYMLEFPNFTTGQCPELISRLQLLVGSENVRVEAITFQ